MIRLLRACAIHPEERVIQRAATFRQARELRKMRLLGLDVGILPPRQLVATFGESA